MEEAECCALTNQRVKEAGEKPGALWHIYDPEDADKIRDLLNKVGDGCYFAGFPWNSFFPIDFFFLNIFF